LLDIRRIAPDAGATPKRGRPRSRRPRKHWPKVGAWSQRPSAEGAANDREPRISLDRLVANTVSYCTLRWFAYNHRRDEVPSKRL
jgi:hypothetical protein